MNPKKLKKYFFKKSENRFRKIRKKLKIGISKNFRKIDKKNTQGNIKFQKTVEKFSKNLKNRFRKVYKKLENFEKTKLIRKRF